MNFNIYNKLIFAYIHIYYCGWRLSNWAFSISHLSVIIFFSNSHCSCLSFSISFIISTFSNSHWRRVSYSRLFVISSVSLLRGLRALRPGTSLSSLQFEIKYEEYIYITTLCFVIPAYRLGFVRQWGKYNGSGMCKSYMFRMDLVNKWVRTCIDQWICTSLETHYVVFCIKQWWQKVSSK